jgi:glycosyltransferase involved in cell wall biosynthesis
MTSTSTMASVCVSIHAALDPRVAGGVQTNIVSLVSSLSNMREQIRPVLLAPDSVTEAWRDHTAASTIRVVRWSHVFPWYRKGSPQSLRERLGAGIMRVQRAPMVQRDRELRAFGAQVMHFPHQVAFDTALPSVYEPWDLQHIRLPHLYSDGERAWRTAMYKRACERASLVVTATAATKRDLIDCFGIPANKIAVIPRDSAFPLEVAAPERRAAILRELGITPPFAFYPAMTFAHKNHAKLFEAMAMLRDRHGLSIKLVCSGRRVAENWPGIEEAMSRTGVGDQVRFVRYLSHGELAALLEEAHLLIFPSLFEGLGLPLLEAMQYGLPIAASAASCIPEVTGDAAALFDPLNTEDMAVCIARVWSDETRRAELRMRGFMRRKEFSWDRAAPTFLAVYRSVAGMPLSEEDATRLEIALR